MHFVLMREAVQIADLNRFLHDHFHPPFAKQGVLAAQIADGVDKRRAIAAARFDLYKFPVRFALLLEVAVSGDVTIL